MVTAVLIAAGVWFAAALAAGLIVGAVIKLADRRDNDASRDDNPYVD